MSNQPIPKVLMDRYKGIVEAALDESNMTLSQDEIEWALAIKQAVSLWGGNYKRAAHTGFQQSCIEGRIDGLYKSPTEEVAAARLVGSIDAFLKVRYHNMRTFKLPGSESIRRSVEDTTQDHGRVAEPRNEESDADNDEPS